MGVNKVKINDIVLIKNPSRPRPYWLLGRVVQLFPGDDGNVRSVQVRRGDGQVQTHSLKHLYPLKLTLTHSYTPLEPYDFEGFEDNKSSSNVNNPNNSNESDLNSDSNTNSNEFDLNSNSSTNSNDINSNTNSNDLNSNSNGVNQPKRRRPVRQAVLRGRGNDPNDPYLYY